MTRDGSDSFELKDETTYCQKPAFSQDSDDLCDLDRCCAGIRKTDGEVHQGDHNDRQVQSRD